MLLLSDRINAIARLGQWMKNFCNQSTYENEDERSLATCIQTHHIFNPWHTETFIRKDLALWIHKLSLESLELLIEHYPNLKIKRPVCHIAAIPGDNLPLDGFADFIFTILAGHHFYGRNNNHKQDLIQLLSKQLITIEPKLSDSIHWCEKFPKTVNNFLVYTASENTSKLSQYLGRSLIRKKRIAVSIINPNDNQGQFQLLANDIFDFFGRSSYNVRKIFIPVGFSFNEFFAAIEHFSPIVRHHKYANHYDYQRNVLLMDRKPFLDNGFMLVKESTEISPPLGCLYYERYENLTEVTSKLEANKGQIQQIVTNFTDVLHAVRPGEAHNYPLWHFEDHHDTMQFLIDLA